MKKISGKIANSEKARMFDALLDALPYSVYFIKDFKYICVNLAKANKHGTTPVEMIGKSDFDYFPENEALVSKQEMESVLRTAQPSLRTKRITRLNTQLAWVIDLKMPYFDSKGRVIGVIGISQDITEQISVQKNAEMVMSILSHELRNCFTGAIGLLNALHKFKGAEKKRVLKMVIDRLSKMEATSKGILIGNVVLNKGKVPDLSEVDFREILDGVLQYHLQDIEDYEKKIDKSMGYFPKGRIVVKSYAPILEVATHTLVSNQISYGGNVLAYGYREDEKYFHVVFYNNGDALPDWLERKLFVSPIREYEDSPGTGFGLLGAKRLLEKISCTLTYEKNTDGHPQFIIGIPKKPQ